VGTGSPPESATNQKPRAPLRFNQSEQRSRARAATPAAPTAGPTLLRYLQQASIRVTGPVTGRPYAFSGARPVQMVDARDAQMLGRSALFRVG
jgi:hypothetical protein